MLASPMFVCIGFMLAVLYIDLAFDMTALPHRRSGSPLPADVLAAISSYYRVITRNPYLLMFVMLTATVCIVAQIVWAQVPRWAGLTSLLMIGLTMVLAVAKVIPTAQRLATGKDPVDEQTRMAHSILPFHIVLLVCILSLAGVQLYCAWPG